MQLIINSSKVAKRILHQFNLKLMVSLQQCKCGYDK
jgi:hypothetical protein